MGPHRTQASTHRARIRCRARGRSRTTPESRGRRTAGRRRAGDARRRHLQGQDVGELADVLRDLPGGREVVATSARARRSTWHLPAFGTVCGAGTTVVVANFDGGSSPPESTEPFPYREWGLGRSGITADQTPILLGHTRADVSDLRVELDTGVRSDLNLEKGSYRVRYTRSMARALLSMLTF